jgi:hypothetical protein
MARTLLWGKRPRAGLRAYASFLSPPVDALLEDWTDAPAGPGGRDDEAVPYDRAERALQPVGLRESAALAADLRPSAALQAVWRGVREQKGLHLERRAKRAAYHLRFQQALHGAAAGVAFQRRNQELRFDEAQAATVLGLETRALGIYDDLLALDPLHNLAGELRRSLRGFQRPAAGLEHETWREEGRGDLAAMSRHRSGLSLAWSAGADHRFRLGLDRWEEAADGASAEPGRGLRLAYRGALSPAWSVAASAGRREYDADAADSTWTASASARYNWRDRLYLTAGARRVDAAVNRFGLADGVQRDEATLQARLPFGRRLELAATLRALAWSDGNTGVHDTLELRWVLREHPRQLTLFVLGEYRDTAEATRYTYAGEELADLEHPYWTPQNYTAARAGVEWRHDLSRLPYAGAPRHYLRLEAAGTQDSENNPGWSAAFGYHLDAGTRWRVELQASVHRSEQWDAERFSLRWTRFF